MATQHIVAEYDERMYEGSGAAIEDCELIQMCDLIDDLCAVIDAVRADIEDKRWLNATEKAYNWLLEQDSIAYSLADHAITLESASEPGRTYTANGVCQCKAFEQSNACWHRAAARLVRRALERYGDTWDKDCSAMRTDLKAQRKAQATADLLECF